MMKFSQYMALIIWHTFSEAGYVAINDKGILDNITKMLTHDCEKLNKIQLEQYLEEKLDNINYHMNILSTIKKISPAYSKIKPILAFNFQFQGEKFYETFFKLGIHEYTEHFTHLREQNIIDVPSIHYLNWLDVLEELIKNNDITKAQDTIIFAPILINLEYVKDMVESIEKTIGFACDILDCDAFYYLSLVFKKINLTVDIENWLTKSLLDAKINQIDANYFPYLPSLMSYLGPRDYFLNNLDNFFEDSQLNSIKNNLKQLNENDNVKTVCLRLNGYHFIPLLEKYNDYINEYISVFNIFLQTLNDNSLLKSLGWVNSEVKHYYHGYSFEEYHQIDEEKREAIKYHYTDVKIILKPNSMLSEEKVKHWIIDYFTFYGISYNENSNIILNSHAWVEKKIKKELKEKLEQNLSHKISDSDKINKI